jgi:NAD(P)-dependent dehydrogenase (short-subunit alcohol dehydrogenase family)
LPGSIFLAWDVTDAEAAVPAITAAVAHLGGLDAVMLNAGVQGGGPVDDGFSLSAYRRLIGVNLDGVVFGMAAALPAIRESRGTIVATASMAGLTTVGPDPIYAATKHAVVGLVRSVAAVESAHGVRVQALCPSCARTPLIDGLEDLIEALGIPLLEVDDVVQARQSRLDSAGTGECWTVIPGRDPQPYGFRGIPGPRAAS